MRVKVCCEYCSTHQLDTEPSPSTADVKPKQPPSARDDSVLGTETVRRRPGEPTSKLAADSTLSPKVHLLPLLVLSPVYCLLHQKRCNWHVQISQTWQFRPFWHYFLNLAVTRNLGINLVVMNDVILLQMKMLISKYHCCC